MGKKIRVAIIFIGIFSVSITGCRSTGGTSADITGLAISGGKEIGRLEQLNSDDERIQRRIGEISSRLESVQRGFEVELAAAAGSADDLGTIIRRVFEIAYGLCDELEAVRGELETLTRGEPNPADNLNNNMGNKDNPDFGRP